MNLERLLIEEMILYISELLIKPEMFQKFLMLCMLDMIRQHQV